MKIFNFRMAENYTKTQELLKKTLEKVEASVETRRFIQALFVKDYMPNDDEIKVMIEQKLKEIVSSQFVLEAVTRQLFEKAIEKRLLEWTEDLQKSMTEKIKKQMGMVIERFDPDADPDY